MNEYTYSILKIKKLDQLTQEIITVKYLISMEDDKLLQEMVENHQTIFKSLSMSKIYFRYLLLQQYQTNKLIKHLKRVLEISAPAKKADTTSVDEEALSLKLMYNMSKLRVHSYQMLELLADVYSEPRSFDLEPAVLRVYLNGGGKSPIAIHRAAYFFDVEYELPEQLPSCDALTTLVELVDAVYELPELYLDVADYFIVQRFRAFDFSQYEPKYELVDAVTHISPVNVAEDAPVLSEQASYSILQARQIYRDFISLKAVAIPDLNVFLAYTARYNRQYFMEALSRADVPCVNAKAVISGIKNQICANKGILELFRRTTANDIAMDCIADEPRTEEAKMWLALGNYY